MDAEATERTRRFGVAASGLIVLFTGLCLYQAYRFWQSPPPAIAADVSSTAYAVSVTITAGVILVVGLYLARNAYRWSTN